MNMSNWITAEGNSPAPASNLLNADQSGKAQTVVGNSGLEVVGSKLTSHKGVEHTEGSAPTHYQGSVLATAKTEGGGVIVARSVRATDQVTLPGGMATRAEVAAHMGYLVRNPDGTFSDVPPSPTLKNPADVVTSNTPQAEPSADDEDGIEIGEEGAAAFKAITETVMPGDAIKAMDEILQRGEVSDNTLARMASMASEEPEQMVEKINAAHQGFYEAASAHMATLGVTDGDAFMSFLGSNPQQMQQMAEAARAWMMNGDTRGMDDVASRFMEQADQHMSEEVREALAEAGLEYQQTADGRLMVIVDGVPVPWNVAVRQQIIRFL